MALIALLFVLPALAWWVGESHRRLAAERAAARHPRARRVGAALPLVGGVVAVGSFVIALVDGGWQVFQALFWPLALLPVQVRLARGPRRAVRLSTGPPAPGQRE